MMQRIQQQTLQMLVKLQSQLLVKVTIPEHLKELIKLLQLH